MRKRTLGVVLLAGLAMSGAGAFTAANDVDALAPANANAAGYAASTVTGATVLSVDYTQDAANASLIDEVKFLAEGDLTDKEASVILWNGAVNNGNYTCTAAESTGIVVLGVTLPGGDTVFTCSTPNEPIADFNSLGITVNN